MKGLAKWSCLGKSRGADEESSSSSSEISLEAEDSQKAAFRSEEGQNEGTLVTVDGEKELEVETLLKASAYILGASRPTVVYKAVLEDGSALVVQCFGEGVSTAERLKDFESQVLLVAKVTAAHPNLVLIRGFYWGPDEKLVIYEYVPNGSLANAHYKINTGHKKDERMMHRAILGLFLLLLVSSVLHMVSGASLRHVMVWRNNIFLIWCLPS